jgi:ubiquinone/menaquinone biosynthesis C-methylase UbiE
MSAVPRTILKEQVRDFWNSEPCGTRYLAGSEALSLHATTRYATEPHIRNFAQFEAARGARVLEIGVGMGADYFEWLKAGAHATGIDLSASSIAQARRRCELAGYKSDLKVADAENLPFEDNAFDIVYSYGVMHHSPDTQRCLDEAWRVLKPGGQARIMLYHHPSLTGLMLWLRFGLIHGKSMRRSVAEHLESPGTKSFTKSDVFHMMKQFDNVSVEQVFSPGDLLLHKPSARFNKISYRMIWGLYPRFLARRLGRKLGLFLLISASKPVVGSGR